jgi:hypothetical protein
MAISNFSELKTAIEDWLDDDTITARVEDFITLAEARHRREIRVRDMIARAQATASGRFLALPAGFLQAKSIHLLGSPADILRSTTPDDLRRNQRPGTGKPRLFAVHEEIEFDITPGPGTTVETIYYKSFEALSGANPTNPLLERAPDVYLYAALVAATPFIIDDPRIPVWEGFYTNARDGLVDVDRTGRNIGPLYSRVQGPTP